MPAAATASFLVANRGVTEFEALRARLDRLDESLLWVVGERLRCCLAVAAVKRQHGLPVTQPVRAGLVHERAAQYAADNGIEVDFVHRLYDLLIDESCRLQSVVVDAGEESQDVAPWGANHPSWRSTRRRSWRAEGPTAGGH